MTEQEVPWELLATYLSGNTTAQENDAVQHWISESEDNRLVFRELQQLWGSTGVKLSIGDIDDKALFEEFKIRINTRRTPLSKVIALVQAQSVYLRVAATVTLLLASYFVIRWATRDDITITTGSLVALVHLPDSSRVWLNVNSKLTYSKSFATRSVELDGEAFLTVHKGTTRFDVITHESKTTVMGTSFNVKAKSDTAVTVTVAEGKVKVANRDRSQEESVVLNAKEKAVVNRGRKPVKSANHDAAFASWRERNNPVFDREKNNAKDLMQHHFTWRKNKINQSVVDGVITNHASLAAYQNIVLEIHYKKLDGTDAVTEVTVFEKVMPGKTLTYRKRLLDILTNDQRINVKIKSANATTLGVY